MSKFIIESGPKYGYGTMMYVAKTYGTRNSYHITGLRQDAAKFAFRRDAEIIARRFSSEYDLGVREVKS